MRYNAPNDGDEYATEEGLLAEDCEQKHLHRDEAWETAKAGNCYRFVNCGQS